MSYCPTLSVIHADWRQILDVLNLPENSFKAGGVFKTILF